MNTNVRVIEAIQSITAIGLDMAKAADCIEELEHSANYWKNSAREFERRLEASERVCANEADSCDKIEAKLVETLKINENLRVARNEECTKYEKVCAELRELQEEYAEMTTTVEELNAKIKELTNAVPADE